MNLHLKLLGYDVPRPQFGDIFYENSSYLASPIYLVLLICSTLSKKVIFGMQPESSKELSCHARRHSVYGITWNWLAKKAS